MEATLSRIDSGIRFRDAGGREVRGTLLHLTPDAIVFEVYSPYPIAEAGDTLKRVQINRGGHPVYTGEATVRATLATGMTIIVTANPSDASRSAHQLATATLPAGARATLLEWGNSHPLLVEYQIAVTDLRAFLNDMRQWLAPFDAAGETAGIEGRQALMAPLAEEIYAAVYPRLHDLWQRIEHAMHRVAPDDVPAHRQFMRRELHPLLMCCPLVHRTYSKPLGYAGDYAMVNMILHNRMEGPNLYAMVANAYFLRMDVAQAHRNRIDRLTRMLSSEARRCSSKDRRMRVLNIGCGPADEVCRFIAQDALASKCEFVLLDFNAETLDYARRQIGAACRATGRDPAVQFIHKSVNDLLKSAVRASSDSPAADFDLEYCAGLFDYLSDRICAKLMQLMTSQVRCGGQVVTTNVHRQHKSQAVLDDLVEWHLILRNEAEMRAMAPLGLGTVTLSTEPTGANLFLEVRRTESKDDSSASTGRRSHRRVEPALGGVPGV